MKGLAYFTLFPSESCEANVGLSDGLTKPLHGADSALLLDQVTIHRGHGQVDGEIPAIWRVQIPVMWRQRMVALNVLL